MSEVCVGSLVRLDDGVQRLAKVRVVEELGDGRWRGRVALLTPEELKPVQVYVTFAVADVVQSAKLKELEGNE
jgi:hypothetical protein